MIGDARQNAWQLLHAAAVTTAAVVEQQAGVTWPTRNVQENLLLPTWL
jgi:hypothetical protein